MKKVYSFILVLCMAIALTGCFESQQVREEQITLEAEALPEYQGDAYIEVNHNIPEFEESELVTESYEEYEELDELGRCGKVEACIGTDIMPTEERGKIGQVKPSGWHLIKYDIVDGKYLYNRCHLIGFQLTGENANEQNLITGTRYLNIEGMLPFENMVADYVQETGNHVLYRVTPIFEGAELLARGVQMEAMSVEDNGKGICFNVYAFNAQPGVEIDYATGESALGELKEEPEQEDAEYVLNKNSKKIHRPTCASVSDMKAKNREFTKKSVHQLTEEGYEPCQNCNP